MAVLDSYPSSNANAVQTLYSTLYEHGQAIQLASAAYAERVKFYCEKVGSPTGSLVARIYNGQYTFGNNARPLGAYIAESDAVDVATLSASPNPAIVEFTFSGDDVIELAAETTYIITIRGTGFEADNKVNVYYGTLGGHAGNRCYLNSTTWTSSSSGDIVFYLENNEDASSNISLLDSITVSESSLGLVSDLVGSAYSSAVVSESAGVELVRVYEVSVNDAVTVSEAVELLNSTEVVELVSVSESTEILIENLPIIVSDVVGITEFVDRNAVLLSTVDEVTVSESSVAYVTIPDFVVSVYSGASLSESVAWAKGVPLWTRELPVLYSPFPELEASAVSGAVLDERVPNTSCLGMMGSSVVEKSPLATLEGSISYSVSLSLNAKSPTVEGEGWLGSSLNKKTPSISLEAESYSNFIGLDKRTPVGSLTASMFEEASLSLDGKVPPFTCAGSLYESYMSMEGKIPCAFVSSAVLYYAGMNLDSMAPVSKVVYDSVLAYGNGMSLDAMAPVVSMLIDTGAGDTEQAILSYSGRFTDYTLEYSR